MLLSIKTLKVFVFVLQGQRAVVLWEKDACLEANFM